MHKCLAYRLRALLKDLRRPSSESPEPIEFTRCSTRNFATGGVSPYEGVKYR